MLSDTEPDDLAFVGLDIAQNAVDYAREAGLLDAGIVADLETDEISASAREIVGDIDVIISTGCVGYVTQNTFGRLVDAAAGPRPPWVASLVLRMFPYEPIEAALAARGLVTEKLEGHTFVQRGFESGQERGDVLARLGGLGLDPAGLEDAGAYYTELFFSRPAADVRETPIADIFEEL